MLTPPRELKQAPSFEDPAPIAVSSRHALAVEEFEQWDSIFSRNLGQIFESSDINASLRFVLITIITDLQFQSLECGTMEEQVTLHSQQSAVIKQ